MPPASLGGGISLAHQQVAGKPPILEGGLPGVGRSEAQRLRFEQRASSTPSIQTLAAGARLAKCCRNRHSSCVIRRARLERSHVLPRFLTTCPSCDCVSFPELLTRSVTCGAVSGIESRGGVNKDVERARWLPASAAMLDSTAMRDEIGSAGTLADRDQGNVLDHVIAPRPFHVSPPRPVRLSA